MTKNFRRGAIAAVIALATALAACSGGQESAPVETNILNMGEPVETTVPDMTGIDNFADPEPMPSESPTAAPAKPIADVTADEQTIDDADAVGMTARVDRSTPAATPTEAPAEGQH
ncbi:MAG: hypothetical protein ACOY45_16275 [Pseudomonadota bacterium]